MNGRLKFKNYIFDFDGTIIDSSIPISLGLVKSFELMGIENIEPEDTYHWIGRPLDEIWTHYLNGNGGPKLDPELYQKMLNVYKTEHDIQFTNQTKIYPSVLETLAHLKENGAKIAVATTKPQATVIECIEKLGLKEYFDFAAGTEIGEPVKPDPLVINKALKGLGVSAEKSVMVGDTVGDVGAGHAAGCKVVAVTYGFGKLDAIKACHPEYVIDKISDLP